ncbi:MAG: Rpn family recombination-promoting nuclease/putative transposase [Eubacterium sp.]|nr:Rpn family recombination-promoting nuclease/putative transposase [Eubacterium sp.]
MAAKLKEYFPMIREREEVLAEITKSGTLQQRFKGWEPKQREAFLDICTGVKGLRLLYNGFFKEIMNPEYVPERLDDLLSCLLRQQVRVVKVLPNDSVRLADEGSLLIMDIVVELEDGSIANVEMQKIGYLFPGQRCACYSADLLLRQYKRVRSEKKKKFSYRDIKNVYTIVLFEKSPSEFHKYPDTYYHFFEQRSDTGLKIEFLQKYLLIPLDIFQKSQHNKSIKNKMDAWLTLFTSDEPETVIRLVEEYPEFRKIYEEGYRICLNVGKVMEMLFSEELYELDRNTVQYMIDEMQDTIDAQNRTIEELQRERERMLGDAQEQGIISAISLLQSLNLPEQEIIVRISGQYQIDEAQVQRYL